MELSTTRAKMSKIVIKITSYYIVCIVLVTTLLGCLVTTLLLPTTSASSIWTTPSYNNSQAKEDYQEVWNELKGDGLIINTSNETILTSEEKESLRVRNNLEIQKIKNGLTPEQEKQLKEIKNQMNKKIREGNKDFFWYIVLGLIFVGFISWGISSGSNNNTSDV